MADSQVKEVELDSLHEAFQQFSQETARLEKAYRSLQIQFGQVNHQLEETNRALASKVLELDETTHYLNNLLSNLIQGIVFIDTDGIVTTYNPACQRILGVSPDTVLFKKFWDAFDDEEFGISIRHLLTHAEAPETVFVEINQRDIEVSVSRVRALQDQDQTEMGVLLLLRDVTEVRRLQKIASRNDRMAELGQMAASLAHEIRNPLGGIKGFGALLKRDLKDDPKMFQMADYIVNGAESLDNLVTNVLNYARPCHVELEMSDLVSTCRSVLDSVACDASLKKHHTFCFKTSIDQLTLPLDREMFKRALLNLIVNGVQASPDGGQVSVSLLSNETDATVSVQDEGKGIEKENLEHIFSPFFTTKPDGNGFGLSEVHKVVQAHGGSIEASSDPGIGTCITIKLRLRT